MQKSELSLVGIALVFSILFFYLPACSYAQLQSSSSSKTAFSSGNSAVSLSSSITFQFHNATLKDDQTKLKTGIHDLLNSGPSILTTSESNQPTIKTKITNQISNNTQSVEGIEATNAIIGVEIAEAAISSTINQNKLGIITVQTSSTCKPSAANLISCDNSVIIK